MSFKYFFIPFVLLIFAMKPVSGQDAIADFTFSDDSDMPSSLLKNSVEGAADAISISDLARSDGQGVFTLTDPTDPEAHVNINLVIPSDLLESQKSIYLEWDYKNIEGENQSAWLINSGENLNFGIFHHSEAGFKIRYYTLEERAGASATPFLTDFIPLPLAQEERAVIAFYYSQEEGMAYLYKNGEVIWKTTDSAHEDGTPFEPTPGFPFYWNVEDEILTIGANMNGGWREEPTLFRFRAFPEPCTNNSPPVIVAEETINEICNGEVALLAATADEAEGYQWYTGPTFEEGTPIEGATERVYETEPLSSEQNFWVTALRGPCESEPVMVPVSILELPAPPQAEDVENCGPGELRLQANTTIEDARFQWYKSSGESSMDPVPDATSANFTTEYLSESATYYVTVINEQECESEPTKVEAAIIEIPDIPEVETNPEVLCGPGQVEVVLNAPLGKNYTYNWYRSMDESSLVEARTSNSITIEAKRDTSFYVRAVNEGCIGPPNRVNISVAPIPSIEAVATITSLIKGETSMLSANFNPDSVNAASLRWEPAEDLSQPTAQSTQATPQKTTTYTVYAESVNGCQLSDTVTIYVAEKFPVTNAFSPNGDGYQDTWEIHNLDQDKYSNCKIMVYNGWGNQVFYSEGYGKNKEWDGTSNGQPLPAGTYYYTIILNESQEPLRGALFIMR